MRFEEDDIIDTKKNVLVFNCGSSSLKYRIIRMPDEVELAAGEAQHIGSTTASPPQIVHRVNNSDQIRKVDMDDHKDAFVQVTQLLAEDSGLRPDLIGHRLVHGGTMFNESMMVTDGTLSRLEAVAHLAPIHNPPATALVCDCSEFYPHLPQVLVFDTAYHSTIPEFAHSYPLPLWVREDLGVRKYGFHGTSHAYVAVEAARFLGLPLSEFNAVSCHLGSGGASLCAINNGRSVDNTMGYSPLQGLLMSTRSGDLDAAVVLKLLEQNGGEPDPVACLLNRKSGILGLSGFSADIRDILVQAHHGKNGRAFRAEDVYLWRVRKYLGAYLTVVDTPRAIIFTDTIGETVPEVRQKICMGLETFGVKFDSEKNESADSLPCDIAAEGSPVSVLVIQTNEELAIARQAFSRTGKHHHQGAP